MKDIDFDELDKAVNSLMQTADEVGATPEVSTASTTEVASAPSTVSVASTPAVTIAAPEESPMRSDDVSVVTTPKQPSLATKRSGRFMDVVHPSSDMRSSDRSTAPTSRTGVVLQPVSQNDTPETSGAKVSTVSDQPAESTVSTQDMPDPIDMQVATTEEAGDGQTNDQQLAEELETNTQAVIESTDDNSENDNMVEHSGSGAEVELGDANKTEPNSPFLVDAKVEKRPLGSPMTVHTEEIASDVATALETPEPALDPMHNEVNATQVALPPELDTEVTKIEASETKPQEVADEQASTLGTTSITQQYRETVPEDTKKHEALYDSASTGAPALAHPAKKRSGWLWIVWIILLIILGAGGAATAYYMKLL